MIEASFQPLKGIRERVDARKTMKPVPLHPGSTLLGAVLAGLALLASGAQSVPTSIGVQPLRRFDGFQPPVPVSRLEYFHVVNYAGRAVPGDVVQVAPGERLIVLGKNTTAKAFGFATSAFKLPLIEETFAENLSSLTYLQGGVPAAFLDEGSYVFAQYAGLEDPTPRQEYARALIGYRVRIEE